MKIMPIYRENINFTDERTGLAFALSGIRGFIIAGFGRFFVFSWGTPRRVEKPWVDMPPPVYGGDQPCP